MPTNNDGISKWDPLDASAQRYEYERQKRMLAQQYVYSDKVASAAMPKQTWTANEKVQMRVGDMKQCAIIGVEAMRDHVAVVIRVRDQEITVIRDSIELFPSDELTLKIKMIVG